MGTIPDSPLGKATSYADAYDASLLFPVERAPQREELGLGAALPFAGIDQWTAWEVSWLDASGKPQVAVATFAVPCESPRIVESKSVKLYLTALNNVRFAQRDALSTTLARDLSAATGAAVGVTVVPPSGYPMFARSEPRGVCIDDRPLAAPRREPDAAMLACGPENVDEALYSRLFRSVCPVTGQPDYATRGDHLSRAAHRPRRAARVPRFLPAPCRLPRALRRADIRRHRSRLPARGAHRACALHASRRRRHQSVPVEPGRIRRRPPPRPTCSENRGRTRVRPQSCETGVGPGSDPGRMTLPRLHTPPCPASTSPCRKGASSPKRCRCSRRPASCRPTIPRRRAS